MSYRLFNGKALPRRGFQFLDEAGQEVRGDRVGAAFMRSLRGIVRLDGPGFG